MVTLDPDNIKEWASKEGLDPNDLEALADNPKVRELIDKEVEDRNSELDLSRRSRSSSCCRSISASRRGR